MSVLEISRVDRENQTYDLAALFPKLSPPFTVASVALLPPRTGPSAATVWTSLTVASNSATVLFAGPDADSTGAVVVTGNADVWIKTTVGSQTDAGKAGTIRLQGGGSVTAPGPLPQVLSVQGRTGAVVLSASDVGADAAGAATTAQAAAIAAIPSMGTIAADPALRAAFGRLTPTGTKTAAYTAAVGDLAMMNVAGGAVTLTLPTAPADKAQVGYRAIGATTTKPLTVNRGGTDTIGTVGATTTTIPLADEIVVLQYDATNTRWLAVSNIKTQPSLDATYAARGQLGQRRHDTAAPAGPIRLMATPPTVTTRGPYAAFGTAGVSSVSGSTYLDRPKFITVATPIGGVYPTSGAFISNVSEVGTPEFPPYAHGFWHQGTTLEFIVQQYSNTQQYRLWVDDQAVTLAPQSPATVSDNTVMTVQVDFGSRATRKIVLEHASLGLIGMYLGPNDTVYPLSVVPDKTVFLGDSWTSGVGATSALNAWAYPMARRLRWAHPYLLGQGGTGWLNPGGGSKDTFINRIAKDVVPANPEQMVVMGGYNDRPSVNAAYTSAALQAAVTAFVNSAFTQLPNLQRLIIAGCQQPLASPAAEFAAATTAISAGVAAAKTATPGLPVYFVDMTGWFGATPASGFGSGSVAQIVNQSGPTSQHPTDEGHEYVGIRMASAAHPLLAV